MRRRFFQILLALSIVTLAFALVGGEVMMVRAKSLHPCTPCEVAAYFTWTTDASNIQYGYITYIDNIGTNNQPGLILQVSRTYTTNSSAHDPHPIGVWYDSGVGQWTIFNEDLANMPVGASFNVQLMPDTSGGSNPDTFQITATASNTNFDTVIDNSILNNNPTAPVLVTQNWTGTYDPHEIGVWYDGSHWEIFNEDETPIPLGASFHVWGIIPTSLLAANSHATTQIATVNNIGGVTDTWIDDPILNGNPGLNLTVTKVWNAQGGCGCVLDNDPVTIAYGTGRQQWAIYHTDDAPMQAGDEFFIIADPALICGTPTLPCG